MADTAIFDVDGTLVDSNYQHALAWFRAFRRVDITLPIWELHRATGMGGDMLVAHVAGDEVEEKHGDELRAAWKEELEPMVGEIQPFDGARELLQEVKRRGFRLVMASSGSEEMVDTFLNLFGGKDFADAWTSSADAEHSKPAPDLLEAALSRVSGKSGVMIGDSIWDCAAANKLEMPTLTVLTGGFSDQELSDAGAVGVFKSLRELTDKLDSTPLAAPSAASA
jgi:HAD superfamily hydrolase (TIGR01549 family)